jgi:hypothetical protein
MNAPRLPAILATLLCMTYLATSGGDEMRGEVSLEATAHEILGDDATTLFGSALDPDEVNEWALYVPESYDPESPAGLLVFISPTDSGRMPGRYRQVLDDNNLIWIGANHSGNRSCSRAPSISVAPISGKDARRSGWTRSGTIATSS